MRRWSPIKPQRYGAARFLPLFEGGPNCLPSFSKTMSQPVAVSGPAVFLQDKSARLAELEMIFSAFTAAISRLSTIWAVVVVSMA